MMIKLKPISPKQLTESEDNKDGSMFHVGDKDVVNMQKMAAAAQQVKQALTNEAELDEAELVNHMYDYKGGVEYILRDPSQAQEVAESITRWTERKGFTIISQHVSRSGKVGYFHFRLGPDPERDAQRIQGYFSSKIEIAKYRFRVREARQRRRPQRNPQI
jgi:hypothetical protein